MMVMMWAFEPLRVYLSRLKQGHVETDDPGHTGPAPAHEIRRTRTGYFYGL